MKKILLITALLATIAITLSFADNKKAKDFELKDSYGNSHKLSDYQGKWIVLEWTNFSCPFVKKHYNSNNMQNLQKKYTDKGVKWFSICSSAEGKQGHFDDMKELNKTIKNYKCNHDAYFIDNTGKVGKLFGARTTPQIIIINPEGYIIYNGAIDNIPSTDKNDIPNAENYLVKVLDAVLNGLDPPISSSKPYGCSVKY